MEFKEGRDDVARYMRRLYRQRLTTTSGGNISFRPDDSHVLLTASKHDKGCLLGEHVGILTLDGKNVTPELVPSIESFMHLAIYRARSDVRAIVHAHPTVSSAFCATDKRINCHLTAEAYAILGDVGYLAYALMGSADLASVLGEGIGCSNCVLMANHGVLTTGATLLQAFDRIEVLEAAASMTVLTGLLGGARPLAGNQLTALDRLMQR